MNVVTQRMAVTVGCAAAAVCLLSPLSVRGNSFVYHFTEVFSGIGPSGSAPWVDGLFEDVAVGTVRLTISNVGLTDPENQLQFYFNLDPSLDPDDLAFTHTGGSGTFDLPTITTGVNAFKADGDGKYDILYEFTPGGVASQVFGVGESVVYEISGIATLTVNDFVFLSLPSGGHGPYFAAAHVQNTGGGGDSGWIAPLEASAAVPEPSIATFFGLSLLFWAGVRAGTKK